MAKGHEETFGLMKMFVLFNVAMVSGVYLYANTNRIVQFQHMYFTVFQLQFSNVKKKHFQSYLFNNIINILNLLQYHLPVV